MCWQTTAQAVFYTIAERYKYNTTYAGYIMLRVSEWERERKRQKGRGSWLQLATGRCRVAFKPKKVNNNTHFFVSLSLFFFLSPSFFLSFSLSHTHTPILFLLNHIFVCFRLPTNLPTYLGMSIYLCFAERTMDRWLFVYLFPASNLLLTFAHLLNSSLDI